MAINTIETWLLEIASFYYRFVDYDSQNMILSMDEWWNFHRCVSKHDNWQGIL